MIGVEKPPCLTPDDQKSDFVLDKMMQEFDVIFI
jgi:hypothetical protein